MKKTDMVRLTLDAKSPPVLTDEQKARLDALAAMPDSQIDFSDAPFMPDAVWWKASDVPAKKQVTLRIDADVLEFFRQTGKRYQTRINDILRRAMLHNLQKG
ncbi:MAG: BrnA antitoxin family protein [Azoarcus sp.]|jgi:uncharacterized protein (DUF4415 family)|nr:BrnA antitoxin family protein [Azoarcus sp.]